MVRPDVFADGDLAGAVLAVLVDAVPANCRVSLLGDAADVWRPLAQQLGLDASQARNGPGPRVSVVTAPFDADRRGDDGQSAAQVAILVGDAQLVVLATSTPAATTPSLGQWPSFWAGLFAAHGWRFVDLVRPGLWEDPRFHPDAKEGWLVFVAPGVLPALVASAPTAMLHPDRTGEAVRGVQAQLDQLRQQFLERVQPLVHRRELEVTRQGLVEAMELIASQRQSQAGLTARLAATERRTLLIMESQLGLGPPLTVSTVAVSVPSRWKRLVRRLTNQPAARPEEGEVLAVTPEVVALFDTARYVADHPEAAVAPLQHYLSVGEALGHRPNPWFDPLFYRHHHPDVVRAGSGLLLHFAHHGGTEGRAVSEEFDTRWYLSAYPEVRESGLNPLLHFMAVGAALGYRTRAQGGFEVAAAKAKGE